MGWMELLIGWCRAMVVSHVAMAAENLALRQQLIVMRRDRPRPRLKPHDRLFWVILSQLWCNWRSVLLIVQPETVCRWHRAGFRLFWRWKSRGGRPR